MQPAVQESIQLQLVVLPLVKSRYYNENRLPFDKISILSPLTYLSWIIWFVQTGASPTPRGTMRLIYSLLLLKPKGCSESVDRSTWQAKNTCSDVHNLLIFPNHIFSWHGIFSQICCFFLADIVTEVSCMLFLTDQLLSSF